MPESKPYVLAESDWKTIRATRYEVAVLPWGATEAHNLHLPYATDVIEATAVAERAAEVAWKKGAKVIVLPAIPFGVNTGQLDIPLTINLNPSTQATVLADVAASLEAQGIHKLVIINSHGGNDFRQMIRELAPRCDVFISTINWWSCLDSKPYFDEPGDHAGELETSVMMAIAPFEMRALSEAGPGKSKKHKIAGLREGWAWAPRKWTDVTEDTGVGNPAKATREKGEKFLAAVTERIGGYLVDVAAADRMKLYE